MKKLLLLLLLSFGLTNISYAGAYDDWSNDNVCMWRSMKPTVEGYKEEEKKRGIICQYSYTSTGEWRCQAGYTKIGSSCTKNSEITTVRRTQVHVPGYLSPNTITTICVKVICHPGLSQAYKKYYYAKDSKAMAVSYHKSGNQYYIDDYFYTHGVAASPAADYRAKDACNKKHTNSCEILFSNKRININLYKELMSDEEIIPANAHASGSGWKCNTGYTKTGNSCKKDIVIPANAKRLAEESAKTAETDTFDTEQSVEDEIAAFEAELEAELAAETEDTVAKRKAKVAAANAKRLAEAARIAEEKRIVIPENAHASGSTWACDEGYIQIGNSCENIAELEKQKLEQERIEEEKRIAEEKRVAEEAARIAEEKKLEKERKAAQIAAKIYFNDLLEFLKINNSEYDIAEIVGWVSKNKAMLTEPWNDVIEKNFDELKDFTSTSKAFLDYHESKNDERQKVILNEFARENTRLKNIHAYLNFYVQNNITSDIAQAVLDQIKLTEGAFQLQSLNELTKVSNQLERFIAKNNLSSEYRSFVKSLSQSKPEKSDVSASTIDDTDLVNFDFIKNADKLDYIALVNLSGKAPNALLNLEGNVVFENDRALSCFYQSKATVKNDLKYYLYDKVSNKEFLAQDRGFECNQNNLLSYDLVFFEKDMLLRESKSYVSSLAAAIAYNQLQLFKIVTNEEQQEDFAYRKIKVANITQSLMDETILGFGSLIIDNDNTTLCTDVENTLGHSSIMNLLSNEFTRMGYGKSVGNVTFNNVEVTFANVQRGRCGFIYAGEESLANLLNAFKVSGTKYDILPIWYSNKQINQEQQRHESKQQQKLIDVQKTKEELEKQKLLEQERLKADGILKAEQQAELRNRNRNIVKAHVQLVKKEASLLLDKDPNNTGEMLSLYPELISFMDRKLKESWELDMFSVEINDYGLGNYRDRVIETFVTDINFKLKNRMLGEYEDFCVRVAILVDKEFDFFREPKLAVCESNSLDSYKKKLDFQSSWIVQ